MIHTFIEGFALCAFIWLATQYLKIYMERRKLRQTLHLQSSSSPPKIKQSVATDLSLLAPKKSSNVRRKEYCRRAVLDGNSEAVKLYGILYKDDFISHRCGQWQEIEGIPLLFAEYYFRYKEAYLLDEDMLEKNVELFKFKNGFLSPDYFFEKTKGVKWEDYDLVMFMPCSTEERYKKRFGRISSAMKARGVPARSGYSYITITHSRDELHNTEGRLTEGVEKNYEIVGDIKGKRILIVDDVVTSGTSVAAFANEIRKKGGEVTGCFCVAKTVSLPTKDEVLKHIERTKKEVIEKSKGKEDKEKRATLTSRPHKH